MAKEEGKKELKDVYRVYVKERTEKGFRLELERYEYESAAGAIKKYEEIVMELEGKKTDKMLIVELQFISEGCFHSLREKHLWDGFSHEIQ